MKVLHTENNVSVNLFLLIEKTVYKHLLKWVFFGGKIKGGK